MSETMLIDLAPPVVDIDQIDNEINSELKTNLTLAIQTDVLKKAVGKVERSIAKKAVQEVYKMIYIDFQEDKLVFRGINNDYLTEAVVLQNDKKTNFKITDGRPGSICFPGDKFSQIVKKASHTNTRIIIEDYYATIKSGRATFDLHGLDGEQFPRTPDLDGGESLSMHPHVLSMMYDRTMYAASAKESRPILTGVHHRLSGSFLKCVATDAHRLGQFVYELEKDHPELSVTIPTTVLNEAKKHLDATDTEVTVYFYDNQVVYEFEDVKIYARVLDGNYPNTDALIFSSEQAGSRFSLNAGLFKSLLSNSTVYNPDQPIIIRIKPEQNQLRVNTREAEVGAFQEDLGISNGEGADLVVGVNVRYLTDALARYSNEDHLVFEFLPHVEGKPSGMQPFKATLLNGNEDCVELFVPVRSNEIDYAAEVVIEGFQGIPEFEFNPFEADFAEIE